jgi:D-xylose transport system substrate-binding protein
MTYFYCQLLAPEGYVSKIHRGGLLLAASALILGLTTACGDDSSDSGGKKIALLLPETQTTRYEQHDYPLFKAKVKDLCSDCDVLYSNASQDAAKQQQQAEAALNNGADVLVLDPVDAKSAANIVKLSKQKKVPVVSYDRLVADADLDYYISFDNEKVGQLQAKSLVDKLKADGKTSGNIVMINGSPTDNNAKLFNKGAHSVLDDSGFTVVPSTDYFTEEWKPENAQSFMDGQIAQLGKSGFVGVYAANDGTAGGAIAAMRAAGISPIPPTTGQDAELAAIQRVISGEQYMTVYKAFKPEADKAAEMAVALAQDKKVDTTSKVDNGAKDVPSVLLTPVAVTKSNVMSTVVKDKLYSVKDICTSAYAAACTAANIK